MSLSRSKEMINEIKSTDWAAFCERLTRDHAGATVKLEVIEASGVKTERVAGAAFKAMAFQKTDACNDVILLRLTDNRETVHEILEPIRIALHPSGRDGDFNPLQIAGENGVFILTFQPAIHAPTLR